MKTDVTVGIKRWFLEVRTSKKHPSSMFKNLTGDEHLKGKGSSTLCLFHSVLSIIITIGFVAR